MLASDDDGAGVLQALPVGVLVLGRDGAIRSANAHATTLFSPKRLIGSDLAQLIGPASAALATASATPARIALPDGTTLDGRSRALPDGGVVVSLLDVTCHLGTPDQAARDPVTGLDTRATLHRELARQLAQAAVDGGSVAVICLSLDRFRAINDTLGHTVADDLLTKVAERLRRAATEETVIALVGGHSFIIAQAGLPQPGSAEALARRLLEVVGRGYVTSGHLLNIGVSIGVAVAPDDGSDVETLLKHGALALRHAETGGSGQYRFFEPAMAAALLERRSLELDLRKALAFKQFELAYQPQVRMATQQVVGFEALLRWRHPERGMVSPASFIPLAEDIGLIGPIGAWVLRTACRTAAGWPQPVSIGVNVSPVQFRGGGLLRTVTGALATSQLDPTRLELEITEGALLENTANVLEALHAIKALGVRIAMDDFGTGYSSLSYLQKFPFDKIKIDQSFVRGADHGSNSNAIVRAVAAIGASLGIKTIAEGIETPEQLDRIRAAGCQEVQGYLTGRPLPAHAAVALMNNPRPAEGINEERV